MSPAARAALALSLLTACSGRAAAAPADRGDLAVQARAIFLKHCAECHGPDKPRAGLPLLDYPKVTTGDWPVPIVKSADPDGSLLLQLVKDGSMPPADRPKLTEAEVKVLEDWVREQAPGYPERFDEAFALKAILADVELRSLQAGTFRYVSLYHLLADDAHPHSPGPYREALARALHALNAPAEALKPIEPTATVLRLDLAASHLDQIPFKWVRTHDDGKEDVSAADGSNPFNLFDLILLEYPFGRLPGDSGLDRELTQKFLVPARQIRPVVYVRGDWLAAALTSGPVAKDLGNLLRAAADRLPEPPTPIPLPVTDTTILPLDAVSRPDMAPQRDPSPFSFQAMDPVTKKPRREFVPGGDIYFEVRTDSERKVYLEAFWKPANGNMFQLYAQRVQREPSALIKLAKDVRGNELVPIGLSDVTGEETLTVFACEKRFPPGEILRGPYGIERIVHRFYQLPPVQGSADPARVIKKTITIEIRKK